MSTSQTHGEQTGGRGYVPARLQRQGQRLLSQQCWLWGQDVKRAEGNLLIAFGFERQPPPDKVSGSTQYTHFLSPEFRIRLWGFGMYFGGEQGIYINRYEFVARHAQFVDGWQAAESMSFLPRGGDLHLLMQAMVWIAAYESWVVKTVGVSYRKRVLHGWRDAACKAVDIPERWRQLSYDLYKVIQPHKSVDLRSCLTHRHSAHISYTKNSWPVA